jgi:hypothetical protein
MTRIVAGCVDAAAATTVFVAVGVVVVLVVVVFAVAVFAVAVDLALVLAPDFTFAPTGAFVFAAHG